MIVVEENTDVGGHSTISGGVIHLGGGTSIQKKFGIVDSADREMGSETAVRGRGKRILLYGRNARGTGSQADAQCVSEGTDVTGCPAGDRHEVQHVRGHGKDPDLNKPAPKYKIQTPPFYAAWATPILHDTYTGLRVNERFQVIDVFGEVIPSFYRVTAKPILAGLYHEYRLEPLAT